MPILLAKFLSYLIRIVSIFTNFFNRNLGKLSSQNYRSVRNLFCRITWITLASTLKIVFALRHNYKFDFKSSCKGIMLNFLGRTSRNYQFITRSDLNTNEIFGEKDPSTRNQYLHILIEMLVLRLDDNKASLEVQNIKYFPRQLETYVRPQTLHCKYVSTYPMFTLNSKSAASSPLSVVESWQNLMFREPTTNNSMDNFALSTGWRM